MIMLRLDSARNNLMRIDLMFSSVTSVAAIGALIAGIFGMNLNSDLEDDPDMFAIVVGIVIGGGAVALVAFFAWTRMRGYLVT
jgi:magnesium transporter